MFLEILDQDNAELLKKVLDYLKRKRITQPVFGEILDDMKTNSCVLQHACRNDNNDFIKILVKNGCRLRTSHETKGISDRLPLIVSYYPYHALDELGSFSAFIGEI